MKISDIRENLSSNKKNLKRSLIIGGIASLPVTGFIYGFVICSDCGSGLDSIPGRIFLGFIYTFFTIFSLGKPWTGSGAVLTSTNLRPYVLLTLIVIGLFTYLILLKRDKKTG